VGRYPCIAAVRAEAPTSLAERKGRDENGHSIRVIDRADGSKHGHAWTDDGLCVAYAIEDGRAFVGASRVAKQAWQQVLDKRQAARAEKS
jgi:hypothetical protein